ncbi:MAG: acyl-CoA dehydrogenase C-terminal domain-containing protein, partial [Pseudomonadota bacterium]
AARAMLKDVGKAASGPHADAVRDAREQVAEATEWMLRVNDINDRFAGSVPYLRAWATLLGAHYLNKAAEIDSNRAALADFYMAHIAPQITAMVSAATSGSTPLYALDAERLAG